MKKRTWKKRGMGRNTVRHIDKHTDRKERKKSIGQYFPREVEGRKFCTYIYEN